MALAVDLGFRLALPILVGALVGVWLDGTVHSAPLFLFVGVLLGVGVAFYALISVSREFGNRKG